MLESLFNKVAGLQGRSFIKKRLQHSCFPVNIAKSLRAPILKIIFKRLLLFMFLGVTNPGGHALTLCQCIIKFENYQAILPTFNQVEVMKVLCGVVSDFKRPSNIGVTCPI